MNIANFMNNSKYLKWANDGQKTILYNNILNYISTSTDIQECDVALQSCIQVIDQLIQNVELFMYNPPKRLDGAINMPYFKKQLVEKISTGQINIKEKYDLPYRLVFPFFFTFFNQDCSQESLDSLFKEASSFESTNWGDEINLLIQDFVYRKNNLGNAYIHRKNFFAYFDNNSVFTDFLSSISNYITRRDMENNKVDLRFNSYTTDIAERNIMFSGLTSGEDRLNKLKKKDLVSILDLTYYLNKGVSFFDETALSGQDAVLFFFDINDNNKVEAIKNLIRTYTNLNKTGQFGMSLPLIQLASYSKEANQNNIKNLKTFLEERIDDPSKEGLFYFLTQPVMLDENNSFKSTDELTTNYLKSSLEVKSYTDILKSVLGASFFTTVLPPEIFQE
ncbi:Uncharacterised protein [Candidatus Tiddalikarchaeum anstoanum]|nr:Uncharacterised protein [Candidatus Tiddalikarchaeum anstoanum]